MLLVLGIADVLVLIFIFYRLEKNKRNRRIQNYYRLPFSLAVAVLVALCIVGGLEGLDIYTRNMLLRAESVEVVEGVLTYEDISKYHGETLEYTGEVTTKYRYNDKRFVILDGNIACAMRSEDEYELCKKGEEITIRGFCARGEENILLLQSLVIE